MAISCWIGAKIEEEGEITVPARLLTEFINSLPSEKVDVSLSPQTKTLGLKCARFEAISHLYPRLMRALPPG
jgi:DNA polymerase-3 subunit beta